MDTAEDSQECSKFPADDLAILGEMAQHDTIGTYFEFDIYIYIRLIC